jgi:hypothetical protein
VERSEDVIPALDSRLRKRLDTHQFGEPEQVFTCRWRRKDAVVALTNNHVILASLGLGGRAIPTKLEFAHVLPGDGAHRTLALCGDRERIELSPAAQAELMTVTINESSAGLKLAKEAGKRPFALEPQDRIIGRCRYAGGAHPLLIPGADVDLVFRTDQLEVYSHPARYGDQPDMAARLSLQANR